MFRFSFMILLAAQFLLMASEEGMAQQCIPLDHPSAITACKQACPGIGHSLTRFGSCQNQYTCTCLN